MRYMALIYGEETGRPAQGSPESQQMLDEYFAYGEQVNKAGVFKSGDALLPSQTATSVRVRDGKTLTTDGPFAETKEQLAGFYVLECKDLDEAISWAGKIPGARTGTIEVRPLMEFPGPGA